MLLLVVLVGAVTLLGKNASSKFSRIDTAIGVPTVPLPTTTTPPVWTPWTSPDGKFTADFPGVPRLLDNPPGARTVSVAEAQLVVGNALYDAGTAELKPEYYYPNDEAGLTKAINIAAEQFKVTVLAPTMGNFAGVNYMDAMITGTLDGTTVRGSTRVFVVGQRIFYAVAFSTDGSHDFTRFVDSFRQL